MNLGIKEGATDVVADLVELDRTMIRFSNNEITISKNYKESYFGIFLMIEKQRAASTVAYSSSRKLEKMVSYLVRTAKITPPAEVYARLPKGPFNYDPTLLKGARVAFNIDDLIGSVQEAIGGAAEAGATKTAGVLVATKSKSVFSTSGGAMGTQERTGLQLSVRAFTSDVASGHSVAISADGKDFSPSQTGRLAGEIAKAASNPEQGVPGKLAALLGPMVFADLINQLGILSSAFLVDSGQSFLAEKVGSEIASAKLTVIDDPTIRGSFGAKAFDDEGVPTRRNVLVDKGVLKTHLHNSTTAKKFGVETTGNAGLVEPLPWNLLVESGKKSFEDLLSEIDAGIYVTNDWYLRYQNYRTGDFSTIPRDGMFLVRKGEIVSSIRELRISDNMIRIMKNISDLSSSRSWIKWWEVEIPTLAPYALIKDLNFTKSRM